MNPAEWLHRTAQRHGARPALFHGTQPVADYAGFRDRAARLGAGLVARGVAPGDRVAVFMANAPDYLVALYGIWFAGAAAVPINAKLHPREADWIIDHAEAVLTLTDANHAEGLSSVPVVTGSEAWEALLGREPMPVPRPMAPQDMAWLFYTSGTTGQPKGVMISCGNIASMVWTYFSDVDDVRPEDAALYAAPMSHGAGLYNFMHVIRAARHIVPESGGFDPSEILRLAERAGPLSMFAAPTMVRRLVDRARSEGSTGEGLRTIVYAGGPMYEADILDAVAVLGPRLIQIYGQGECPMGITALPRQDVSERNGDRWRARLNSVGRAQSAVEVRILAADGSDLPPDTPGEIAVRGATVMAGYWRNPEATAETLRDGWLWTGDIGTMDCEGYVTLRDRSKDLIITGGSNVYPREVEEVLLTHEAVREVAVVGRDHPEWGEEVVAFVVGDATPETLDALCLERIARFKRPKAYVFVEELPKNNYGKVLKTELRARLKEAKAEGDATTAR